MASVRSHGGTSRSSTEIASTSSRRMTSPRAYAASFAISLESDWASSPPSSSRRATASRSIDAPDARAAFAIHSGRPRRSGRLYSSSSRPASLPVTSGCFASSASEATSASVASGAGAARYSTRTASDCSAFQASIPDTSTSLGPPSSPSALHSSTTPAGAAVVSSLPSPACIRSTEPPAASMRSRRRRNAWSTFGRSLPCTR